MSTMETVYIAMDNTIDLLLKSDGVDQDLSSVTRMVIAERNQLFTVDSSIAVAAFDWDTGVTGKVVLALGDQDLPVGDHVCKLIVYDPSNDDGIVWDLIVLRVVA